MRLSLAIATFNEEKFIHYPLDSAYDLADEVVIVDGGSTDRTVEVAKSYGKKVRIFHEDNPPMFHINKQKAIERARGEWILQLDADEELSEELKEEIKEILTGDATGRAPDSAHSDVRRRSTGGRESRGRTRQNFVAYWLPRKNYFLGRFLTKGGAYPDYTIRLYHNGVAHFPCKTVHENVEVKGEIGFLQSPILHYADPHFSRYIARWHRYNSLDADLLVKEGKKLSPIYYFIVKPIATFFSMYIRHKGFMDSWQGFIFALFSSIRYGEIYTKVRRIYRK
ncbi:glycosyltransferase family 2 protein [Candidatus Roizmanbacteria bacterium]|nr:glycosyltransferase family 2 protein [Candidatus Roizmanbacteria bacterium]